MRRRYKVNIIIFLSTILLIVILGIVFVKDKQNQLESNTEKMVEKAEWFWNKGDYDRAVWQLNVYLQTEHSVTSTTQAYLLLEKYYNEMGKKNDALECKTKIAELNGKDVTGDDELVVSASNIVARMEKNQKSGDIVIETDYYDTDSMVLQVTSSNLMPDIRFEGSIVKREEALDESLPAKTSDWFSVCDDQECLTISGGFNSSVWQFKDKNGVIIDTENIDKQYNDLDSHYTGNMIWSTVSIPKGAVSARVTFWNGNKTSVYDNSVCINYGSYPDYSVHEYREFEIPNLTSGEKLQYNAKESTWIKITQNGEKRETLPEITINGGDTIALSGISIGSVEIKKVIESNDGGGR